MLGKYLSLVAMFAVPVANLHAVSAAVWGHGGGAQTWQQATSGMAYLLMAAAGTAVCMYLSALTGKPDHCGVRRSWGIAGEATFAQHPDPVHRGRPGLIVFGRDPGRRRALAAGLRSAAWRWAAGYLPWAVWSWLFLGHQNAFLTSAFNCAVLGRWPCLSRFLSFANGLFDLGALVYYASVAALFLFLTSQALEKRRWN